MSYIDLVQFNLDLNLSLFYKNDILIKVVAISYCSISVID